MEPKALLSQMADIFEATPERWTHGAFARDVKNAAVETCAPNAYSFSVNGFLERSAAEGLIEGHQVDEAYALFIGAVKAQYAHGLMVRLNDVDGREAVIACAREAAK